MAKAIVKISHPDINSGNPVRIMCNNVSVSGKKNNIVKPNANLGVFAEVQTQSVENLKYTISGIDFVPYTVSLTDENNVAINPFTYNHMITLYKVKFAGLDDATYPQAKLNVIYGNAINLVAGSDLSTTDIPVVLETPGFNISAQNTDKGYMPNGSITFVETV